MKIDTGKWSEAELDRLLRESSLLSGAGMKIDFLSQQFLGVPYSGATLGGGVNTPEELRINLAGVDCFTFPDYVEAMRLSASFGEFVEKLRLVRYRSGSVSFVDRNHFFTDWAIFNAARVEDATEEIGQGSTTTVNKTLNLKGDGTSYLAGIPTFERTLRYIPAEAIGESCADRLRTGDYAGIYSDLPGLDVSHAGIVIRSADSITFRHASSSAKSGRVVDEDFKKYIAGKPGLIILRPREPDPTGGR